MDCERRCSLLSQVFYSLLRAKSSGRSSPMSQDGPLARPTTPQSPASLAAPLTTHNRSMLAHWVIGPDAPLLRGRDCREERHNRTPLAQEA